MINRDRLIDNFEREYQARIAESRPIRIKKQLTYAQVSAQFNHNWSDMSSQVSDLYETVEAVEIIMPRDKLPNLLGSQISAVYEQQYRERMLRDEYPALQNAWEQYQTMLAMISGDSLMNPRDKY